MDLRDATPREIGDELLRRAKADQRIIVIFHVGKRGWTPEQCPAVVTGDSEGIEYALRKMVGALNGESDPFVTVREMIRMDADPRN